MVRDHGKRPCTNNETQHVRVCCLCMLARLEEGRLFEEVGTVSRKAFSVHKLWRSFSYWGICGNLMKFNIPRIGRAHPFDVIGKFSDESSMKNQSVRKKPGSSNSSAGRI